MIVSHVFFTPPYRGGRAVLLHPPFQGGSSLSEGRIWCSRPLLADARLSQRDSEASAYKTTTCKLHDLLQDVVQLLSC